MALAKVPEYLVIDGGTGTEVISRFGASSDLYHNPLWGALILNDNEAGVKAIHKDFLEAGADVILTNTYKPNVASVMEYYSINKEEAMEFFRKAARIACRVRDDFWESVKDKSTGRMRPIVAASIGPYGAATKQGTDYAGLYIDKVSTQEMVDAWKPHVQALIEGGAEILGFETIPATKEAQAIYKLLEHFPHIKAWVAFCCKDGEHVCHGETFKEAVLSTLSCDQVIGVGVNCSGPVYVTSLLKQIPTTVREKKKIVVYPNNGLVFDTKDRCWRGDETLIKPIQDYVSEWLQHGANWIGGCCNVTPQHITLMRKEMECCLEKVTS